MSNALVAAWVSVFDGGLDCAPSRVGSDHGVRGRQRRHDPRQSAHDADVTDINGAEAEGQGVSIDGIPVAELLDRLRAGDQAALSTLYLAVHDPLWRLGVILLGSAESAEEIVQDIFLAVWVRREALAPGTDIRAYLYAALRNAAKMRGRHARVVGGVISAVIHDTLDMPARGQAPVAPDQAAEVNEFYVAYTRALGTLSERERLALQLRIEEDMTFEQIGQVLALSKVGARTVVLRAEAKVRDLLAEYRT